MLIRFLVVRYPLALLLAARIRSLIASRNPLEIWLLNQGRMPFQFACPRSIDLYILPQKDFTFFNILQARTPIVRTTALMHDCDNDNFFFLNSVEYQIREPPQRPFSDPITNNRPGFRLGADFINGCLHNRKKIFAQERNLFFIKRRGIEHLDFSGKQKAHFHGNALNLTRAS